MKQYICLETVHAEEMTNREFASLMGYNPAAAGEVRDGYCITYNKGTDDEHTCWGSKDTFEKHHSVMQ